MQCVGQWSSDSSCLRSCLRAVQKLQGMANRPWKQEAQHLVPRMARVCRRCDTVWRTHKDYLWWCKHIQSKCQPQIEEWHVVWDIMKLWKDSLGTVAKPLPRPVISHSGLRSMPSDDNHRSTVHFKATISAAWKKRKIVLKFQPVSTRILPNFRVKHAMLSLLSLLSLFSLECLGAQFGLKRTCSWVGTSSETNLKSMCEACGCEGDTGPWNSHCHVEC